MLRERADGYADQRFLGAGAVRAGGVEGDGLLGRGWNVQAIEVSAKLFAGLGRVELGLRDGDAGETRQQQVVPKRDAEPPAYGEAVVDRRLEEMVSRSS